MHLRDARACEIAARAIKANLRAMRRHAESCDGVRRVVADELYGMAVGMSRMATFRFYREYAPLETAPIVRPLP